MLDRRTATFLGWLLLVLLVSVTLVVAPYSSMDPINLPKMSVLAFLASIAFALLVFNSKILLSKKYKTISIVLFLFVVDLLAVFLFSGSNFIFQFYGTYGRNTGLLTYLCLAAILLSTVLVSNAQYLVRWIAVTVFIGVALIIYGEIQYFGKDPFPYVNAYGSNVFGTFGNQNFQSAFLGMMGAVFIGLIFNKSLNIYLRILSIGLAVFIPFQIKQTTSEQGFLNFAAGGGIIVVLYLFMSRKKILALVTSGFISLGGFAVLLGLVNIGPLAETLYKSSLLARGFYWRAALNMLGDHPFFGVGLDGFGNWYRRSRTLEAVQYNAGLTSDAAHNVFLDIATTGGLPLITIYLVLFGFVVKSIVSVVRRSSEFNANFAVIVGAWVAYQTQSFVSINQIGLAIWGWVLSGLIIGYEINTREYVADGGQLNSKRARKAKKFKPANTGHKESAPELVISVFIGFAIGLVLALPPYVAATKYYKALQSGDAVVIQSAAYLKPIELLRFMQVARTMQDNKLDQRAVQVTKDMVQIFPDSFEAWSLFAGLPAATPAEVAEAKAQMRRLDPLNPNL